MPNVLDDAIAAAKVVLGGAWDAVSTGASAQISNLVQTAKYISDNRDAMTEAEAKLLASQQTQALQNVLTAYEAIGLAAAQNAVAAVVNAIIGDLPKVVGIL